MELALEHELFRTNGDLYYAFSKLIDVKAYTKIFMCSAPPTILPSLPELLRRVVAVSSIKVPEEKYLLIIFSEDKTRRPSEPNEQLSINGYSLDYEGALKFLGNRAFPIAPQE